MSDYAYFEMIYGEGDYKYKLKGAIDRTNKDISGALFIEVRDDIEDAEPHIISLLYEDIININFMFAELVKFLDHHGVKK